MLRRLWKLLNADLHIPIKAVVGRGLSAARRIGLPRASEVRATARELLVDNPMLEEGERARRRFFQTGGAPRTVNYVASGLIGLLYLWILMMIVRFRQDMTSSLFPVETFLLTAITGASIYGAVAGERERATWEGLIITRMTPAQIITGKVVWRLKIALLIIVVMAVPIGIGSLIAQENSFSRMFGLWTPDQIALGHFIAFSWAVLVCAYGLWVSAHSRRSVTAAAVLAGTLVAVLFFLPMLIGIMAPDRVYSSHADTDYSVTWACIHASPFTAISSLAEHVDEPAPAAPMRMGSRLRSDVSIWTPLRIWNTLLPWLYLFAAAIFFYETNATLRRLEEPRRRSDH